MFHTKRESLLAQMRVLEQIDGVLQEMLARAQDDTRVDALIGPIGKGELVCRKL